MSGSAAAGPGFRVFAEGRKLTVCQVPAKVLSCDRTSRQRPRRGRGEPGAKARALWPHPSGHCCLPSGPPRFVEPWRRRDDGGVVWRPRLTRGDPPFCVGMESGAMARRRGSQRQARHSLAGIGPPARSGHEAQAADVVCAGRDAAPVRLCCLRTPWCRMTRDPCSCARAAGMAGAATVLFAGPPDCTGSSIRRARTPRWSGGAGRCRWVHRPGHRRSRWCAPAKGCEQASR